MQVESLVSPCLPEIPGSTPPQDFLLVLAGGGRRGAPAQQAPPHGLSLSLAELEQEEP